ncbi:MAG: formamidopyrimidine-DNA glycosylase, partial [Deltaproteobacteria bacterium]|nr:formamidopyrimidine-DNA glycosylase [Deltaproteobacteria bacterium]
LQVYDRKGAPCYGCGAAIKRIGLGNRGAFYCPRCQR